MIGRINQLESFGTVDGPGIRFVVFFQGCPLRCQFCHNPDTWSADLGNVKNNGKRKVTVYARKRTEKIGFDYAAYDVDFSTGKYEYSGGTAPDTKTLEKYLKGNGSITR